MMRLLKDERGQALVVTLVSMAMLLAFMGLAIDVGLLFRAKRNMQIAADAAAMAGAMASFYGQSTGAVKNAGYLAAKNNGVDNGNPANTVHIDPPPVDGPNQGCTSCVEARVATPNPTFFMNLFGIGNVTVAARAVAGAPGAGAGCIWLMDPTMDGALNMQGAGLLNAPGCAIYVNSNSATAVTYNNGHPGNIVGSTLAVVGNDTDAKNNLTAISVAINAAPLDPPTPLNLPGIPSGGCSSTSNATEVYSAANPPKSPKSTQVSDASVAGSSSTPVVCFTNSAGVTLDDGVVLPGASGNGVLYVFEKGVTMGGAAQFGCYGGASASPCGATPPSSGAFDPSKTYGATLDIDGGALSQANGQLTVFAPTSGTYASIAVMQPTSNKTDGKCPAYKGSDPCTLIQRGSSNSTFDGIIYAPGQCLEIQDGGGAIRNATGLIAACLYAKGSGSLNMNSYSNANPTVTPFKLVTLVE